MRRAGRIVETEVVTRFKTFARERLLAALREADSADLRNEQTDDAIREAFAAEQGWPGDLDRVLGDLIAHK